MSGYLRGSECHAAVVLRIGFQIGRALDTFDEDAALPPELGIECVDCRHQCVVDDLRHLSLDPSRARVGGDQRGDYELCIRIDSSERCVAGMNPAFEVT